MLKAFMLSILLFSGIYAAGSTEDKKVEQKRSGSGISGTVRFKDAEPAVREDTAGVRAVSVQNEVRRADQGREALIGEINLLHKKLIEITEKNQTQNEDYRRLRLSIAATLASREKNQVGKREDQLVETLARVTEDSRRLTLKTVELCDYVEALVKNLPLGGVKSAELALKLDEQRREVRKAWYLVDPKSEQPKVDRCRLLAVDDDLQIVVLPVGSNHGIFCGLSYYVGKDTMLRIIVVKPHFSAAMVTNGSIKELAPGMEARLSELEHKD